MKKNKAEMQVHLNDQGMFEGWYLRISDRKVSLAVIIGISETTAFIQTIDTYTNESQMINYDLKDFEYGDNPFFVKIKDNYFSKERVILNLDQGSVKISGELVNETFTPLKSSLYAPTIMGPFYYLPKMECNHGIISLTHRVKGRLMINQQKIKINGIGYIEKDWGYSFPKDYLWLQSNDCNECEASVFLAIAKIPLKFTSFTGIIMVLMIEGKQQKIASYYGAYLKQWMVKDGNYYLNIKQYPYNFYIKIIPCNSCSLKAPQLGMMSDEVKESLNSKVTVLVYKHHKRIDKFNFIACGVELFGGFNDVRKQEADSKKAKDQ